jgi:hypothetical protein
LAFGAPYAEDCDVVRQRYRSGGRWKVRLIERCY